MHLTKMHLTKMPKMSQAHSTKSYQDVTLVHPFGFVVAHALKNIDLKYFAVDVLQS